MPTLTQHALTTAPDGAVLGRDVLDTRGRLLLGKGAVLDARARDFLRQRGIASVSVVDAAVLSSEEQAAWAAEIAARLARRFRQVADDPAMQALHQLLRDYRLGG